MKTLRLFGGVSIADPDGSPLPSGARQRHRLALLALLAVETRGLSRDKLTGYLWPERDTRHARNLLNVSVYVLRSSLGEEVLLSDGDDLRLNPQSIRADAGDFEAAMVRQDYETAVSYYEGPFLDGFFLAESQDSELWADRQRERFAGMYVKALESLACAAEARGDAPGAVEWWKRRMAHDRFDSRVTVRLMRALDMAGNRAGALEIANTHAELLREEFAAESGPEVVALAEQLRRAPAAVRPPLAADNEQVLPRLDEPAPLARPPAARRRRGPAALGGLAMLAILALVAAGGIGWQTSSSAPGVADRLEPTLAIMPFEVIGPDADLWSEGLASLLSANLDGVDGLRVIDPQVILARWGPELTSSGKADRAATIREIGRVSGASHVLQGSLVGSEGSVRLTAQIRGINSRDQLGTFHVEGQADSILALADQISLDVLRGILAEVPGRSRLPDLARVVTRSLPALKSFLAGERAYRRLRWQEAISRYNEAVELDSTFALALYRLAMAHSWHGNATLFHEYSQRAVAMSDRLSEREQLLLEGQVQITHARPAAIETFRQLVEAYPDYVEGWNGYGEALAHTAGPWANPELTRALRRVLELDPGYGPARIHLLGMAIITADTSAARELVSRQQSLEPGNPETVAFGLAGALAFGDSAAQAQARADLARASEKSLGLARWFLAGGPDQSEAFRAVVEAERERGILFATPILFRLGREGRFSEARIIRDRLRPDWVWLDASWHLFGHEGPDVRDVIHAMRDHASGEGPDKEWSQFLLGALAAHAADWELADSIILNLRIRTAEGEPGDSAAAQNARSLGTLLRAYAELCRGAEAVPPELEAAVPGLSVGGPAMIGNWVHDLVRFRAGRMLQEHGHLAAARSQYEHMVGLNHIAPPEAEFYLAQVYEGLGDRRKAITAYDRFLRWTERADPEYAPLRREAAEALHRLRARSPS